MATQNRNTLKGYFNTGDKPTESEFSDLIDSSVHLTEDRSTTAEVQAGTDNTKFVTPAGAKASVQKFAPNATTTVKGLIEIATIAEAEAGTSSQHAVTPAGAKAAVLKFAVEDTGWQPVNSFANGTTHFDSESTVRYRRKNKVVFLDGKIRGGTNQTNGTSYLLFALSAEFAPQRRMSFVVIMATSSTTSAAGRIDIHPDGRVYGVLYSSIWTNFSDIVFNFD